VPSDGISHQQLNLIAVVFFSLTGTEPWHYYFVNGFLNFNIVFLLALFSLPLTALMEALLQRFNGKKE